MTKTKKPKKYGISAVFTFRDMEDWKVKNDLVKDVLGHSYDAGTGFGERDMQWYGLSREQAQDMKKKFNLAFKGNKDFRIGIYEDDYEEGAPIVPTISYHP